MGVKTLVATTIAIEFTASVKPFRNEKIRAATIAIATTSTNLSSSRRVFYFIINLYGLLDERMFIDSTQGYLSRKKD
jgi:hypothetical protein